MQRLARLLDRRVVVPAVDLVEIDVVGAEPAQRPVDAGLDVLAGEPVVVVASRPGRPEDLGEDLQALAPLALQRAGHRAARIPKGALVQQPCHRGGQPRRVERALQSRLLQAAQERIGVLGGGGRQGVKQAGLQVGDDQLGVFRRELRARQYDLVLNPGASDRATVLTWLSGGRQRLGRLNRNQSKRLWPLLHDAVIDHPWGAEPMYWQKLTAFQAPLQLDTAVHFGLDCSAIDLAALALPPRYIHISPFASEDIRCLPLATLIELAAALRKALPDYAIVVSCGPAPREQQRLAAARPALDALGVHCLAGTLGLPALAAVIAGAALHIGPDSGPLHLAVAQGTPSVACFLFKDASAEWMPVGLDAAKRWASRR